jgi:hypothetical protein
MKKFEQKKDRPVVKNNLPDGLLCRHEGIALSNNTRDFGDEAPLPLTLP